MRREKLGGEDMDREFARNVVRMGRHFKGAELRTGCVFVGSVGGWESIVFVRAVLFLSLTHIFRSFLCGPRKNKYRDQAGMDEEEDIDTRMFERREDRLTDKARSWSFLWCICLVDWWCFVIVRDRTSLARPPLSI